MIQSLNEICYKKNFLRQVLIRIDFLNFVDSEKILSPNIINKVQKYFPQNGKQQLVKFSSINININENNNVDTKGTNSIDGIQQDFFDKGQKKLTISNKFMVFEIQQYNSFNEVYDYIRNIIQEVFSSNKIIVSRTGIRYINLFDSSQIKITKKLFASSISATVGTKLSYEENNIQCIRSLHINEYQVNDDMMLKFQYGMYNPNYPSLLQKKDFVLDYDCSHSFPLSSFEDVMRYIEKGHDTIQYLFEISIGDSLRDVLNNG